MVFIRDLGLVLIFVFKLSSLDFLIQKSAVFDPRNGAVVQLRWPLDGQRYANDPRFSSAVRGGPGEFSAFDSVNVWVMYTLR